jgi:hypothetical protein
VQVTTAPAALQLHPSGVVADAKVTPAGSVEVTTSSSARSGPALATITSKVKAAPDTSVAGTLVVVDSRATGANRANAASWSDCRSSSGKSALMRANPKPVIRSSMAAFTRT